MNGDRELPARPGLEQYKKQATDLVKAFEAANPEAMRWSGDTTHACLEDQIQMIDRTKTANKWVRHE